MTHDYKCETCGEPSGDQAYCVYHIDQLAQQYGDEERVSGRVPTTDNDGVKVVAIKCGDCDAVHTPDQHQHGFVINGAVYRRICHTDKQSTPLISALDEADAVDRLCPLAKLKSVEAKHCLWPGHAHADKLRGLGNKVVKTPEVMSPDEYPIYNRFEDDND